MLFKQSCYVIVTGFFLNLLTRHMARIFQLTKRVPLLFVKVMEVTWIQEFLSKAVECCDSFVGVPTQKPVLSSYKYTLGFLGLGRTETLLGRVYVVHVRVGEGVMMRLHVV